MTRAALLVAAVLAGVALAWTLAGTWSGPADLHHHKRTTTVECIRQTNGHRWCVTNWSYR